MDYLAAVRPDILDLKAACCVILCTIWFACWNLRTVHLARQHCGKSGWINRYITARNSPFSSVFFYWICTLLSLLGCCTGDEGGWAFQVRRGDIQRRDGTDQLVCGEASGVCVQQDQRRHVHVQSVGAEPHPPEAHVHWEGDIPQHGPWQQSLRHGTPRCVLCVARFSSTPIHIGNADSCNWFWGQKWRYIT